MKETNDGLSRVIEGKRADITVYRERERELLGKIEMFGTEIDSRKRSETEMAERYRAFLTPSSNSFFLLPVLVVSCFLTHSIQLSIYLFFPI